MEIECAASAVRAGSAANTPASPGGRRASRGQTAPPGGARKTRNRSASVAQAGVGLKTSPLVCDCSVSPESCGLPQLWQRRGRCLRLRPQPRTVSGAVRWYRGHTDQRLATYRAALGMALSLLSTVRLPVQGRWGCQRRLPQHVPPLRQGGAFGGRIQPIGAHDLQPRRGHVQEPALQKVCDCERQEFTLPAALPIRVLIVRIEKRDPLRVPGYYPGGLERPAPEVARQIGRHPLAMRITRHNLYVPLLTPQ